MSSERLFGVFKRMKSPNRTVEKSNQSHGSHNIRPSDESSNGLKILHEGDDAVIDIVAIHGLNGHRETTWTASNGSLWLRDFLPQQLPKARIMSWGYNSNTHSTNPISAQHLHDHADTLISDLCLKRALTLTQMRPMIFIAHSLGGLVLKSALIHSAAARPGAQQEHRSIYEATYGIIFAGTPHQGGDGVTWGLRLVTIASIFINTNDSMLQHLQRDSEEVQRLMRDYAPISNDFRTKFAYETLPTVLPTGRSIMIVPKASAVIPGLPNAEHLAIHRDHSNMVKFMSADDEGYEKVSGHIFLMAQYAGTQIRARGSDYALVKRNNPPKIGQDPVLPNAQLNLATSTSDTTPSNETDTGANVNRSASTASKFPGWTVLHGAANNNSVEGVAAILAMGNDPNVKTADNGWTPLWAAACHGNLEISRLLIDAGANVNISNHAGTTPIKEAAQIGALELVRLLIERGADVNIAPHHFQDSPLIVASAKNHTEVVRLLLEAGADSRAQQSGGWSSLHYALMNKNEDMAILILDRDPDLNASTKVGLTPLHLAALVGYMDICAYLVDHGANLEAVDDGGLTALRVAVQAGELDTVKLLVERGANTEIVKAHDGHSLTEVALMFGHVSMYRFLEERKTR